MAFILEETGGLKYLFYELELLIAGLKEIHSCLNALEAFI